MIKHLDGLWLGEVTRTTHMFKKLILPAVVVELCIASTTYAANPSAVQAGTPRATGDLFLEVGWDATLRGETPSVEDLKVILQRFASARIPGLQEAKGSELYGGVTYLMPRLEATRALRLPNMVLSKHRVTFPGFPAHSFYIYDHDGRWENFYNKLLLVTDKTDQVVAVELIAENPKTDRVENFLPRNWHVFDFINFGTKALTTMLIKHEVRMNREVLQLDSALVERRVTSRYSLVPARPYLSGGVRSRTVQSPQVVAVNEGSSRTVKVIRLYLPKPIMELSLYTMSRSK